VKTSCIKNLFLSGLKYCRHRLSVLCLAPDRFFLMKLFPVPINVTIFIHITDTCKNEFLNLHFTSFLSSMWWSFSPGFYADLKDLPGSEKVICNLGLKSLS
jgi:hypothetical protein